MRLKRYIAVSVLLFNAIISYACWWDPSHAGNVWLYRIMPLDESDYSCYETTWTSDYILHHGVDYKKENLRLWQQETSKYITIEDIEAIVYKASLDQLRDIKDSLDIILQNENRFVSWIKSQRRMDIIDYLIIAKQIEGIMRKMNDPWYYDVEDNENYLTLEKVIEQCSRYKAGSLHERYALQMVRALCLSHKYEDAVRYWRAVKKHFVDNAVKKMIELKVASALYKTDQRDQALEIYAKYGDVASIRAINGGQIEDELTFVYEHDPNSPYIDGEIQKWLLYFGKDWVENSIKKGNFRWDAPRFESLLKVAHRAVKEKKSKKLAMWYYTLAALYDAKGGPRRAKKYLERGQAYPKDPFLRDSYHVLQMWLDARTASYDEAYEQRLMNDLKWLVGKVKKEIAPEVYDRITPKKECYWLGSKFYDYYSSMGYQDHANNFYWNDVLRRMLLRIVCPRMHKAGKYVREIQLANMAENLLIHINEYSNEMFQIMDRLSYKDTRNYFYRIYFPQDEFDIFLNGNGKIDKYYWYDILATKCLRERRYHKAIVYLRQVPLGFQKEMNAYSYMSKDPFSYDMQTFKDDSLLADNYKLRFAEKMSAYEETMKHHRNPNKRAEAKIMYALGLRNSVHRCWFLTRYSSNGGNDGLMYNIPEIAYPEDSTIYRHYEYIKKSDNLIKDALTSFTDKELAAQHLRKFLYYKRILDDFGDTETASDIKQHCDRWRDYAQVKKK